jgi:hypothetical protein
MAYTSRSFLKDLAIYSTGAAIGIKNTAKFTSYAAKKGIQLAGIGATRAAPPAARGVASLAQRFPRATGVGLGLGFLETEQGEALLQAAAERGAADRIRLEQAIDERIFAATRLAENPMVQSGVRSTVKRKVSKYSKAVKAGMAAVRASKFNGKKGTISNAKRTFATVSKVASAVNRGKKVASKGVRGTIARAVRKVL